MTVGRAVAGLTSELVKTYLAYTRPLKCHLLNTFYMFNFTVLRPTCNELDLNLYGILSFRGGLIYDITRFILL